MHISRDDPFRACEQGAASSKSMPGIPACAGQAPPGTQKEVLCHLCRQLLPAAEAQAAIWWLRLQAVARPVWLRILSSASIADNTPGLSLTCFRSTCAGSQCQGLRIRLCAYHEIDKKQLAHHVIIASRIAIVKLYILFRASLIRAAHLHASHPQVRWAVRTRSSTDCCPHMVHSSGGSQHAPMVIAVCSMGRPAI